MTRVGFLGVLISLIVLVLVGLMMVLDTQLQVDAFPVIVCALCVERWWKQWGKDGPKPAAKMALNTFLLAVVIQFVMVSDFAMSLIEWSPLLMPATTAIAIAVLGRYRGLRLTEISRFAPIWLERRRQAKAAKLPEGVEEERRTGLPDTRRIAEPEVPAVAPVRIRAHYLAPRLRRLPRRSPLVLAAIAGTASPLSGIWVIGSPTDLRPDARRRVPQVRPNRDAQFEPRLLAAAGGRPGIHNAWVIRKVEDV
jgi:hypothetical protein